MERWAIEGGKRRREEGSDEGTSGQVVGGSGGSKGSEGRRATAREKCVLMGYEQIGDPGNSGTSLKSKWGRMDDAAGN